MNNLWGSILTCTIMISSIVHCEPTLIPLKDAESAPDTLKGSVTFIYKSTVEATTPPIDSFQLLGTGFFVAVRPGDEKQATFAYLVTNKHVIGSTKEHLTRIFLRLTNKKTRAGEFWPIDLSGDQSRIFVHPNPNIDLVAINYSPSTEYYDYVPIDSSFVPSQNAYRDLKLKSGLDVFLPGLFVFVPGRKANTPLVRFGKIALVSDELISWGEEGDLDLLLIEAHAFGGSSGSPVFYLLHPSVDSPSKAFLVGVMKGQFQNPNEVKTAVINDSRQAMLSFGDAGINAVIPSFYLEQILFSNKAVEYRKHFPQ